MRDFLKELCIKLNIGLKYEDGGSTILSNDFQDDTMVISASRIFSNCPEEIAKAVVNYYTGSGHIENYLKLIEEYADENLITVDFKINPPYKNLESVLTNDKKLKEDVSEVSLRKSSKIQVDKARSTSSLVEIEISSITQKDFWGAASESIQSGDTIRPTSDDVLELDIVVDDSNI